MERINYIFTIEKENPDIYCHRLKTKVIPDDLFFREHCRNGCPYLYGSNQGRGVECYFEDVLSQNPPLGFLNVHTNRDSNFIDELAEFNSLTKSKDISKLIKRKIVDKNGKTQTVWVKPKEVVPISTPNSRLIKQIENTENVGELAQIILKNKTAFVDKSLSTEVHSPVQLFIARAGFLSLWLGKGKSLFAINKMKSEWNKFYGEFDKKHKELFTTLYKSFANKNERYLFNLMVGAVVELEHTDDISEAITIARTHLDEGDNYYELLLKMEDKLSKSFDLEKSHSSMGVGTIHKTPSGKLVKKVGEGKWVEVRDDKSDEKKSFKATDKDTGTKGEAGKETKTADGIDLKDSKHKGKKLRIKGHGKDAVSTRYHGIVGEFTGEFNHEGKPKLKVWDKIKNAFAMIAVPAPVLELAKSQFLIPSFDSNKMILIKSNDLKEIQSLYEYEYLLKSTKLDTLIEWNLIKADRPGSKYLKKIKLGNGKFRYVYDEKEQPAKNKRKYEDSEKDTMLERLTKMEHRIKELTEKKQKKTITKPETRELENLMGDRVILKKQYDKRLKVGAEDRLGKIEKKRPESRSKKKIVLKKVIKDGDNKKIVVAEIGNATRSELQKIKEGFDLVADDKQAKVNILTEREIKPMTKLTAMEIDAIRTDEKAMANFLMDNESYWWSMAKRNGVGFEDREDAVQEIKLKIWEMLKDPELRIEQKNFKTIGEAFATYVWSIARFKAMAFKNSIRRHEDRETGEISRLQEWEDEDKRNLVSDVFHAVRDDEQNKFDKQDELLDLRDRLTRVYREVEAKIDKKQKQIFDYYLLGYKQPELAEKFKVNQSYISQVINKIKGLFATTAQKMAFAKSIVLTLKDVELLKSWGAEIPFPLFKSGIGNSDCIPLFSGEWNYFFKSKAVPIGSIREWKGVKMKKTGNGKWEPVGSGKDKKDQTKPDDKTKKQQTKSDGKKEQKTVKYSDAQKGKIKGFMKKFLEFVGDIFTSHDVGMGKVAQAANDLDKDKQTKEETPEQKKKTQEKNNRKD